MLAALFIMCMRFFRVYILRELAKQKVVEDKLKKKCDTKVVRFADDVYCIMPTYSEEEIAEAAIDQIKEEVEAEVRQKLREIKKFDKKLPAKKSPELPTLQSNDTGGQLRIKPAIDLTSNRLDRSWLTHSYSHSNFQSLSARCPSSIALNFPERYPGTSLLSASNSPHPNPSPNASPNSSLNGNGAVRGNRSQDSLIVDVLMISPMPTTTLTSPTLFSLPPCIDERIL